MDILIVDDDRLKIEKIEELIFEKYKNSNISKAFSYQSGLKSIMDKKNIYDLILLDMSMPTFDITSKETGGQLKELAGKDIMRHMKRKKRFIPVIVITQYDRLGEKSIKLSDIMVELNEKYSDFYIGTVYYDTMIENWKTEIINFINKALGENNNENFNC